MQRRQYGIPVILAVMLLIIAASTAQADDVLRYRVTSYGGRMYEYWKFSNASRTIQSGDYVEYDVYLHDNASGVGGLDIYFTDGSYLRDTAGWQDQNGIGGHPVSNISSLAYGKWYHRKLALPGAVVGKKISFWDLAVDGNYLWFEVPSAMYNNVCITNGGSPVLWAYQDGQPSLNTMHFNTSATVQSAQMFATTPRRGPVQVASHLFYWYDAPNNNADPYQMIYDPHGLSVDGPWDGYGLGYYSSYNVNWWEGVFQDMKRAGVDIADLICWGNHPGMPWFRINTVIANQMVQALERSGVGIKIALFDDTTSECCEWNMANGRGYTASPQMPLSDSANWTYFYDLKIKPFFQAIPRKYWATHNGASLENGGRPIIITYSASFFSGVKDYGGPMWSTIKSSFARDFKDANGNGITPFIIHERSWFDQGGGSTGDGEYAWGAALNGPSIMSYNNYYTGCVGPGYDDRLIRSPGSHHDRALGSIMQSWYNGTYSGKQLWNCNLLIEETWNELWEGTGIERCVNHTSSDEYADPSIWGPIDRPGSLASEMLYIDTFGQKCITNSVGRGDWDATFLKTWTVPTSITRGSTVIPTHVRNDGFQPWDPNAANPVRIGFWLEDANGNQVPNSSGRVYLSSSVLIGNQADVNWTAPSWWPTGTYYLRLDMVAEWLTWFSSQGDTPVKVLVNIN